MRIVLSFVVSGFLATIPAIAAEQTWAGQLSDSMCGAKHMAGEHGKTMTDRECTQACARKGAQYVLVSDGKVYKLTNHDADLAVHAGHAVRITGEMRGDAIRVARIEMTTSSR
jgi:general stress protein YciG